MNAKDSEKLLSDAHAFHQRVRMAAVQVAGLGAEELATALAYEVEPFSGIPADEAEAAFRPVAENDASVRVYDVAVRRRRRGRAEGGGAARWVKPLATLGVLAVLVAGVEGVWLARKMAALERKVAEQSRLDAEIKRIQGAASAARQEAERIRSAREAAVRAQDEVASKRAAYPALLHAIAVSFGDRAVLQEISKSEKAFEAELVAVAATPADAADVLTRLTSRATTCGWTVIPGVVETSKLGTTTTFRCRVAYETP